MERGRTVARGGVLALLLAMRVGAASAAWVVNDRNECVRTWTPASLARGPAAMLKAPLLPFRSAAGGLLAARDDRSPGLRSKVLLAPLLTLGGGAMGLVESGIWLGTGLADTATGGYFEVAPEEATELSLAPERPSFGSDSAGVRREAAKDRCGRG